MRQIFDYLAQDNYSGLKDLLDSRLRDLVNEKVSQMRTRLINRMFEEDREVDVDFDDIDEEFLEEGNVQKMGRTKLVRVRIRGGKVQRRKKVSGVKGYTMRGGRLTRMTPTERRHRRLAARMAKFKRRAKMSQIVRKRQRSLRRRHSMGL